MVRTKRQYDDDTIQAWFGGAIYQMWQAWKHHGQMPMAGGWLDQPLSLWVQIQAIDLVHDTWAYKNAKGRTGQSYHQRS